MKRKGKFLILENGDNDIINIKHICSLEKYYKKGTKIKLMNGSDCYIDDKNPEEVLGYLGGKKYD